MNQKTSLQDASPSQPLDSNYIFIAEDDIDDEELIIEAIRTHTTSFEIRSFNNGRKAINFLENLSQNALPCLVILDYNLPEVDGSEILEQLSKHEKFNEVPKVVWSTSNSPVYRQICLDRGAKAYYVKPADIRGIQKVALEMLSFCEQKAF